MNLQTLTAVSPVDGRYYHQTEHLSQWFSEWALMKYRLHVEVEYFILLAKEKFFSLSQTEAQELRNIVTNFSFADAEEIKKTEVITNHDVKAIEYFLKEKITHFGRSDIKEWIHFGLTSQDINNTAIPLLWKDYVEKEYLPSINKLQQQLQQLAQQWKAVPMLARTHGQPASPTVLGKEIMVFVERLQQQILLFENGSFCSKIWWRHR